MNMIPVGHRLEQVIPDVDELFLDPVAYLSQEPLVIRTVNLRPYAVLFLFLSVAVLGWFGWRGATDPEAGAIGAGLLIGALFWWSWGLWLSGHRLVLHVEGLEIVYRDTVVWCQWALL